jgi:hypothetical protein
MHHGLEYTLNYTYAKSLTNSSGNYGVPNTSGSNGAYQNGYNSRADYGPAGMDIRHSLNFVGVYDLPFGRGRSYGSGANSVLDAVFGGWKVSAAAFLYSGFPITINAPGQSNTNSFGQSRANQYRKLMVRNRTINHWWGTDPSAQPCVGDPTTQAPPVDNGVCAYGLAYNGGSPTFGTARINTERAPGYSQVDTSLFKEFHVWREQVVGFRADFFNVFNLASYGNPDNNVADGKNFGLISGVRSPPRQIQLSLHYAF